MEIKMAPIGFIESEYSYITDIPKQSFYNYDTTAKIVLLPEYEQGLTGLQTGQMINIIFYFHKSSQAPLIQFPHGSNKETGVFNIRSPHRPNHIGISRAKIIKINKNELYFAGVDMLNDTPVLDIKPIILSES
ncbi:tRNA (N6-threonylcarbamoyladenosine(37)-N6)-methyltransferase TrmO [Pectinatus brassicae]|uniref:tRNA-Thr(GGU) m(6)t(6)A37 methyltransferase TsaA n=1 Tax=Pectinatus brassicae TaxID=862415 RepID=A0A840UMV9_9FIRM|nr:tRNA (N6-threonylcarbamoyladenosine(37)-N6)-methyltransferase TrmO [Pectinatus brassicae]MBB5336028.1 tRNA-Thr(GGU) m(6)t(6)A37 methyltransferase TsaA [Pectinatus brassicae]